MIAFIDFLLIEFLTEFFISFRLEAISILKLVKLLDSSMSLPLPTTKSLSQSGSTWIRFGSFDRLYAQQQCQIIVSSDSGWSL